MQNNLLIQSLVENFLSELLDMENLLELVHLGSINTHSSKKHLEDSALRLIIQHMEASRKKFTSSLLEELSKESGHRTN